MKKMDKAVSGADRVTVVIPNWNGMRFLAECLAALEEQSAGRPRVIVVDNGSEDGSCDLIRLKFPWVSLIPLSSNEGFGRAVNRGIRAAETEFTALLNNDAVPEPDWLRELLAAMDANPDVGSCASKIVFYEDPGTIDSAGDSYAPWGVSFNIGHNEPDGARHGEQRRIFGPCAAAALYRKSLFDRVGLFDENFFAYYEDTDFNMRALLCGNKSLYVPGARVRHHYSGSSAGKKSKLGSEEVYVHMTGAMIKGLPAAIIVKHCLSIAAVHGAILFFWLVARVRGKNKLPQVPLLKFLASMLSARGGVQKNRKISLSELNECFCYKTFAHYLAGRPKPL